MLKRIFLKIFLIFAFAIGYMGCKSVVKDPQDPKSVVTTYLGCRNQRDYDCLYKLLTPQYKEIIDSTTDRLKRIHKSMSKKEYSSCIKSYLKKHKKLPDVITKLKNKQDLLSYLFLIKKKQELPGILQRLQYKIRRVKKVQGGVKVILTNSKSYIVVSNSKGLFIDPGLKFRSRLYRISATSKLLLYLIEDPSKCKKHHKN